MTLTIKSLEGMSCGDALRAYLRRFRWLCRHRDFLLYALDLHGRLVTVPDIYYLRHLPRWAISVAMVEQHVDFSPGCKVIDLAAYRPFTFLMAQWLNSRGKRIDDLVYTVDDDASLPQEDGLQGTVSVRCEEVHLGPVPLPWEEDSFDLMMVAEVIEHLDIHPQFVLAEANRVLKAGGFIFVSTPNVTAWKKIYMSSNGNWDFDSPTFCGKWGHRYEYSCYQIHSMLQNCGFEPVACLTRDVYMDDPSGIVAATQFAFLAASKAVTGQLRALARYVRRRGSGAFFLYRKVRPVDPSEMRKVRI